MPSFLDPNTSRCARCNGNLYLDQHIELESGRKVYTATCLACAREYDLTHDQLTVFEELKVELESDGVSPSRRAAAAEGRHSKRYSIADVMTGWIAEEDSDG